MIDIVKNIVVTCGGIAVFISALYTLRKFCRSVRPIKIVPSININLDGTKSDSIGAVVTNRSEESLYIVDCFAQESKPIRYAILTHLMHPLIKPSLYPSVWWGAKVFGLLNKKQHKLEAGETVELKHELNFNHPLAGFCEHDFKVIVKLSTGRKVVSQRLGAPMRWHVSSLRNNA